MENNNLRFQCKKCGECCSDIGDFIFGPQKYGYNYLGQFVRNPKTSIPVHYSEAIHLYQKKNQWQGRFPKLFPLLVLYLRDNPIGYIFYYQIEAMANSSCSFYDKSNKGCMIYEDRPAVCRFYPLMLNINNPEVPNVLLNCKITKKYETFFSTWDKSQMQSFFGETYESLVSSILKWQTEYQEILEKYSHLFLEEIEVNPQKIAPYKYRNFLNFHKLLNKK